MGVLSLSSSTVRWLMLLYGIQGIPYGFQVAFLPILLHSSGASLTKVSLLKALNLPWMLKLLWAPMVTSSSSIKQPLTYSLVGLAIVFNTTSMISVQSTWLLSCLLLAVNILVSIQDIAVDTFAIQTLSDHELGAGNAVQVVAYKVGAMLGGGVLTWASQFSSWNALMMCVALVYLTGAVFIHCGLPKPTSIDKENEKEQKLANSRTVCNKYKFSQNSVFDKNYFTSKYSSSGVSEAGRNQVLVTHRYNLRSLSRLKPYESESCVQSSKEKRNSSVILQTKGNRPLNSPNKCNPLCEQNILNKVAQMNQTASAIQHNSPNKDSHNCTSSVRRYIWYGGPQFEEFAAVLKVPNTTWIMLYLLIYKLGEQGAISMFPLYLLDCQVSTSQVAVWTGMLAQWTSIVGSLLGGWLISPKTRKQRSLPTQLTIMCLSRLILMVTFSFLVHVHQVGHSISVIVLCIPLYLILITGGAITTATFTLMMTTSQQPSHPSLQTLHHTTMATAEVLGKVVFTSLAGLLVDQAGYVAGFYCFAALSILPSLPLLKMTSPFQSRW